MGDMNQPILRIATRKSPLAMWQATHIKERLETAHPGLHVEIMGMMTQGDKLLATPLAQIGGKGLFVKELEKALYEHQADIAVHSIKDMPVELPDGLTLATICQREDPRDVFVSNNYASFDTLPKGAVVGSASLRRQCQLKALRPDIEVQTIRGNVGTRLRKLDEGKYDAIILAAAGLKRLALEEKIQHFFDPDTFIPAIGQGALGIECREADQLTLDRLSVLDHVETKQCVKAERAVSLRLGGSCQAPIGAHATIVNHQLKLTGLVGQLDGKKILRSEVAGEIDQPEKVGEALADELLSAGAKSILDKIMQQPE